MAFAASVLFDFDITPLCQANFLGQGPIALAVGAGGGLFGHFSLSSILSFLSPSLWETARYRLKFCLKGPLNPKQPTNQANSSIFVNWTSPFVSKVMSDLVFFLSFVFYCKEEILLCRIQTKQTYQTPHIAEFDLGLHCLQ